MRRAGPLSSIRIVELAGIGPGPFCAMVLADLGAEVVRVDRASAAGRPPEGADVVNRSRPSLALDLKHPDGAGVVLRLVERADALIEGFRPGVAERLGVGPEECLARNPRLVYGRMTGWGQSGPYAPMPGHDINYIAISGALGAIGRRGQPPVVPLNLVGDYGGGGMLLATGVLAGIVHAARTGEGQVVDAAMSDGSALLMTLMYGMLAAGSWTDERGSNLLDGSAPFYDVYETADGPIALGGLEPQFHAELLRVMGIADIDPAGQYDTATWPALRARLERELRTRTRAEWEARFAGTEVCVAPVLSLEEAPRHAHNAARGTFADVGGVVQPAPAPRFSATPSAAPGPPPVVGADTTSCLSQWGFEDAEIDALLGAGAVRQA
jgi:alpha-methylacyl-CoA racemase